MSTDHLYEGRTDNSNTKLYIYVKDVHNTYDDLTNDYSPLISVTLCTNDNVNAKLHI